MSHSRRRVRDPNSVEMFRVWVADRGLHCSMRIGMYEAQEIDESVAWGTILADALRHAARALSPETGQDAKVLEAKIRAALLDELGRPTSGVTGDFVAATKH